MDYLHLTERLHVTNKPNPDSKSARSSSVSSEDGPTFPQQFRTFARFGDAKSLGHTISLSNSDKWLKQAHVIDGKRITTTDTGIYFRQMAKTKKNLTLQEYERFLEAVAKQKNLDLQEMRKKMSSCGLPATNRTTAVDTRDTVRRLTDHSKYTGMHRHRTDHSATRAGRGKETRAKDPLNDSGYVQSYRNKETYAMAH